LKAHLQQLVVHALKDMQGAGLLPAEYAPAAQMERARDRSHGDFACNVAMTLAKVARRKPRDIAQEIIDHLPDSALVQSTQIAGPGFINFRLAPAAYHNVVQDALDQGDDFGRSELGGGRPVQVEFVSANPTGPLHVGHGRGAAYGATVSNLLAAVGFAVQREYYVNDAGRQMDILATSRVKATAQRPTRCSAGCLWMSRSGETKRPISMG
jgi:arginyl-tRNA synthetase